jgi:DNA-binding PucR family transcriptional regulator
LPRRPYLLVAAPSVGDGGSLIDRARVALQELGGAGLTLITRGQLVVIGESTDMRAIRRALETAGLTGVVLDVADLTDLAAAYQRAREVHDFMQTARLPGALTVGPDEALVLSILARARRDELVGRATAAILGPLADHAELLDTLDAYLLTGNAVSAAHRLGIHAQTMRYRLRRIREITGRDPAQGWDRFLLEFALRMT